MVSCGFLICFHLFPYCKLPSVGWFATKWLVCFFHFFFEDGLKTTNIHQPVMLNFWCAINHRNQPQRGFGSVGMQIIALFFECGCKSLSDLDPVYLTFFSSVYPTDQRKIRLFVFFFGIQILQSKLSMCKTCDETSSLFDAEVETFSICARCKFGRRCN